MNSRLIRRLASPRLAAWLIVALIVLQLLAVVVPQRGYLGDAYEAFRADSPALARVVEALGLDAVFGGWPIAVVCVLLVVNTLACTWLRYVRWRRTSPPGQVRSEHATALHVAPEDYLAGAGDLLVGKGWRVIARSDAGLVARRGAIGFVGSLALHLALLVIMLGGAVTALTSFRGEMVIAGGQELVDEKSSYFSISNEPEIGPAFTGATIGLDDTEVVYEGPTVVSAVATMHALDDRGRLSDAKVRVNHPFDVDGKSYLLLNSGYSVGLVISEPGAQPVPVVVSLGKEAANGWGDTISVAGLAVELLAVPDAEAEAGKTPERKLLLPDPRLHVIATSRSQSAYDRWLKPGESADLGNGASIVFEDARLWNKYLVRGEPARWITYVGFWLAVLGAAVRFAVPERRIAVAAGGSQASVQLKVRPWEAWTQKTDAETVQQLRALAEDPGWNESEATEGAR